MTTNVEIIYPGPPGAQGAQGPIGPVGPTGPEGDRGAMMFTGEGPPDVGTGLPGDSYVDITTGQIWSATTTGWVNTGENIFGTIPADAEADADRAEAARIAAEAAASTAAAATDIYPTTAAGLAATPEGEYFWVAPPTVNDAMPLYQEVGGVAVLKGSIPSAAQTQAAVDSSEDLAALFPNDEYIVYVFNQSGGTVAVGGYPFARHVTVANTLTHVFVEIVNGDEGTEIDVVFRKNGIVVTSPETVVKGTPLDTSGLSVSVVEGDELRFEIMAVTGNVHGVWAQIDGEIA